MSFNVSDLIPDTKSNIEYKVFDLFRDEQNIPLLKSNDTLRLLVAIGGGVRMVKLTPKVIDRIR